MKLKGSDIETLTVDSRELLKQLISIPSLSREEDKTADCLEAFFRKKAINPQRLRNNIWITNKHYSEQKPTLLLNSHHDTVKPNNGYTLNPFEPVEKDGKLFGLGSNDAGGALVSLLAAFLYYYEEELPFNLIYAATAEEEISGQDGIELLVKHLPAVDCAIIGEPTLMKMAIAEKGLLVLDCKAKGKAGHAARDEGVNALYIALEDIRWAGSHSFERVSALLGPVHLAVTSIETPNKAHNVVPDECNFIMDVRVNELYSFEEILSELQGGMKSTITPRSLRLKPSSIASDHPLVRAGSQLGLASYGSPTCSDMTLIDFPALKIGPGDSARSHTADEFIFVDEIEQGIRTYISLIGNFGREIENSKN
ncbi:MAG TPA: M20 family metallo-hydrolase [Ginsengibacter sp.]|nr:M20 family metallo-hydrolase [Ginsengibacter sp.]HRP18146.1 M20 family metallo-hydrolase [Ginsengibacter sp.]HRP44903.1 M20 family metallo-hydrolase [Ginsengibacter sp.]